MNTSTQLMLRQPNTCPLYQPSSILRSISPPNILPRGESEELHRGNDNNCCSLLSQENKQYWVDHRLLKDKTVNSMQRAKLKNWLIFEMSKSRYYRETYVTASKYLDLYFMKGKDIETSQLQMLGLACFILAAKVVESRVPAISYQTFSKKQLLFLEQNLCLCLNFKLTPMTYITLADNLLFIWDTFATINSEPYTLRYNTINSILKYQRFVEILDTVNLDVRSLEFQINQLVIGLFFLEHRVNCCRGNHPQTVFEIDLAYEKVDQFSRSFKRFMLYLHQKHAQYFPSAKVNLRILKYLLPFLKLRSPPSLQRSPGKNFNLRRFLSIQTHNDNSYELIREKLFETMLLKK